eukprot:5616484-Pleurochrysis_carterae.AAC.1
MLRQLVAVLAEAGTPALRSRRQLLGTAEADISGIESSGVAQGAQVALPVVHPAIASLVDDLWSECVA